MICYAENGKLKPVLDRLDNNGSNDICGNLAVSAGGAAGLGT